MPARLEGKKAIVTGGAQGIGRGCALELAREGADLLINDFGRGEQLQSVVEEIRGLGREAAFVEGDAFDRGDCENLVTHAVETMGRIDIVVSNPALNSRAPFLDYDPEAFDKVIKATLYGGFHLSQLAARHMVERGGGGKIVFISSMHARTPISNSVAYNTGKKGLLNMAFTIANELTEHRINVNVIEPGWIDTPGEHDAFGTKALKKVAGELPWKRMGTPRDIGRAVVFLSSDDADYITGATLPVDGGQWLGPAKE